MKESEIRPRELFEKYITLSNLDGQKMASEKFQSIPCPACGTDHFENAFVKNEYHFNKCVSCYSLYCSPRPSQEQLDQLYFNSESSQYWSNVFFPAVKDARREKLFRPKASQILKMINAEKLSIQNFCDVGAGHGLLLEEIGHLSNEINLHAIEPDSTSAQICREKGIEVLEETSEKSEPWHGKFDLVLSSEVIEHVYSPESFIRSLYNLTKDDGHTLITGLGHEGFDILTLQEKSNSVSAPHHLNFMSVEGFEKLFKRVGFKEVKVWTPGKLDVDIVVNSGVPTEFIKALQRRGDKAMQAFQQFLVDHKLSSHIWVLAKK
jgi:2-polyprenyl-3-methyl-5-hydroxy-6-metoxy-1,4-benzoquinol methylase